MKLDLQRFGGGGSSSGSPGATGNEQSGNQYSAEHNFWKKHDLEETSGMNRLFIEANNAAGGKLGKDKVRIPMDRVPRYLRGELQKVQREGGTEHFSIVSEKNFATFVETDRTGMVWLSERMKKIMKTRQWW